MIDAQGVEYLIRKARSTAKHSNGVEWIIYRDGSAVDYARKLKGAQALVEDFASGTRTPIKDA